LQFEDKQFDKIKNKDENDGKSNTERRIQVHDECKSSESATTVIEKARITYLQPLKAKLQSVNPLVDDQVTQCKVNQSEYHNPYRLRSIGVPTSYHTTDSRDTSRIFQRSIRQPCQCEIPWPHSDGKKEESHGKVRSAVSRHSSTCSLQLYTEDLYCDDELHPSLENNPNMMLYTKDISNHAIDSAVFDLADDESILSMELPSTRPQSIIDTDYGVRFSTVIAWGVEQDSEDSE